MTPTMTRRPPASGSGGPPAVPQPDLPASQSTPAVDAGWGGAHPVNIRIDLPSPWGRMFVVLLAGRERRSPDRRRTERARHPVATFGNVLAMLLLGIIVGGAGLGAIQLATALLLGRPEIVAP